MTKLESIFPTPLIIGKFDSIEEAKLYYYNSELSETCMFMYGIAEFLIGYNEDKSEIKVLYIGNKYDTQMTIINKIIINAIRHGADLNSSNHNNNIEELINSMKEYLNTEYYLKELYEVKTIDIGEMHLLDIPLFVLKEEFKN